MKMIFGFHSFFTIVANEHRNSIIKKVITVKIFDNLYNKPIIQKIILI